MPSPKRAVLLVNLGSPASTDVPDVRNYLREFLGDERVIDIKPRWLAWVLVNWVIAPTRAPKSAKAYREVWQPEGSPLVITSKSVRTKLASALGADAPVYLAMRYGQPSIANVITQMLADGVTEVLLFPQYPHYAMSSWETVEVKVFEEAARIAPLVKFTTVLPFYQDADYIEALHTVSKPYFDQPHDFVLFSYHGIPVRHLRKGDASNAHCTLVPDCCNTCSAAHAMCYKAQITKTTQALVKRAGLADGGPAGAGTSSTTWPTSSTRSPPAPDPGPGAMEEGAWDLGSGSDASVTARPRIRYLAPRRAAASGVTTRCWSWLGAPAGRSPGTSGASRPPNRATTAGSSTPLQTMPCAPAESASAARRSTSDCTSSHGPRPHAAASSSAARLVSTVTPRMPHVSPAPSTAAASIASPPDACTVSSRTSCAAARRAA
jgi:ferrochelatase